MSKTIFEKIIDREMPANIVYEDENFIAFLDIKPKKKGHTLVITKHPFKNILEVSDKILEKYLQVVKKVAHAIKKGLGADGFNIIMNNESAAGQEIFHAHIHIIPRFNNDEVDLNPGKNDSYSDVEEMQEFQEKIINSI